MTAPSVTQETTGTYAEVIEDSVTEEGHRLTTMEVRFHRFVLAEFNTHRVFSRNSASSRAIPLRKQVERVRSNPAMPVSWPAEQKGMQGGEELAENRAWGAQSTWHHARADAVRHAESLSFGYGVHKSVVNRLLEPFMWHTVIVSATDWSGFFEQRCSPLAQPEIRVAAEMMREAYESSEPTEIKAGDWHLPYVEEEDITAVLQAEDRSLPPHAVLARISAARCARVSYLTQDGRRDIRADLTLYERLVSARPPHFSPLEHVATPWSSNVRRERVTFKDLDDQWQDTQVLLPRVGNFLGWRQLRFEVEAALNPYRSPYRKEDN